MFQNTINLKNDQHRMNIINVLHYARPVNSQEDEHQNNDHLNTLMMLRFLLFYHHDLLG